MANTFCNFPVANRYISRKQAVCPRHRRRNIFKPDPSGPDPRMIRKEGGWAETISGRAPRCAVASGWLYLDA